MSAYRRPGAGAAAAAAAGGADRVAGREEGRPERVTGRGEHDGWSDRGAGREAGRGEDDGRAERVAGRGEGRGEDGGPRRRRTRNTPVALEIDGRHIPLTGAVSTLGRDESCTVMVDDPGASRRHAEVRISHDGPHLQVILRDLGSTNGTYLNGEQVGSEELRDRDRITMGRTHIVVHLEG